MWEKISTFASDVRGEFARVSWPTRENLISSTWVVMAFAGIFAIFSFLFDNIIAKIMQTFLGL